MKPATSLWAFGATTVALGLVVVLALRGGAQPGPPTLGLSAPGNKADFPPQLTPLGGTYVILATTKPTGGQPLTYHAELRAQNGAVVGQGDCTAGPGDTCVALTHLMTAPDCVGEVIIGKVASCATFGSVAAAVASSPPSVDAGFFVSSFTGSYAVYTDEGVQVAGGGPTFNLEPVNLFPGPGTF